MTPERRAYLFALFVFVLLTLLWGYNWIAMKVALAHAAPFDFAALRVTLGIASLFLTMSVTGRSLRPQAVPGTLLLGLFQTTGFITCTTWALAAGGVGKTSVLVFAMPFWTLILSWLLLGERIRGLLWPAIGLALLGLVLILEPWALGGSFQSKLLAIAGGVMWASSVIVAKRLRRHYRVDVVSLTAWQMVFGSVPIYIIAWLQPSPPVDWTPEFIAAWLYAGLLGMSLGWLMWLFVLNRVPAGTASLNSLAIPVIAVVMAWLQLGETPGELELWGMLSIGCALALVSWVNMSRGRRL